jgi:hypothetical protein
MSWQLSLVLCLIAVAAAYLVRQSWRTWTGQGKGCGGRCQCGDTAPSQTTATSPNLIPVEQLTLRLRSK